MAPERHPDDGWLVLPFPDAAAFESWLDAHHADEPGLWVKLVKTGRGIPSVSFDDAQEIAACFGWVDSKLRGVDADYYVLRYQPRKARSSWTPGNRDRALRLIEEGRMRPSGIAAIEAAKASGRWPD